jgi:PAT family beta-lactamase induction signal transducer AmpG
MNKRLWIIFILGFSSGLPLALLTSTLQAWFSESGLSVASSAMLSLVGFPYIIKMFWAPFLDKYSLSTLGKRRSWIITTQILLLIGFNIMAWFTPNQSPAIMSVLAFILAGISATQDASIDAQRLEYLPVTEHGLGVSIATFGYRIALFVSGGVALILASRLGWVFTYRLMGFIMILGIVATLISEEPNSSQQTTSFSFIEPFYDLFKTPGILYIVLFILFFKLAESFTSTSSGIVMPFLIEGLGFSLEAIGYINKMLGIISIVAGGLLAGILLMRWSLYKALFIFGLVQAFTTLLFVLMAMVGKNLLLFGIAVACDNFATGMGSTALVAFFMHIVNKKFTATQFAILVAIATIPRILSGPIAAGLQMWFGWVGMYQIAFLLGLGFIPCLLLIKKQFSPDHQMQLNEASL